MYIEQSIPIIGKDNVKKTLELFKNIKKLTKKKIFQNTRNKKNKTDKCNNHLLYCNPTFCNKKPRYSTILSCFFMTEMRLCLMKHNWIDIQRLFLILLDFLYNKEFLVWRYAITILVHSTMSSIFHIEEFLNLCIGSQDDNHNYILNQLKIFKFRNKNIFLKKRM